MFCHLESFEKSLFSKNDQSIKQLTISIQIFRQMSGLTGLTCVQTVWETHCFPPCPSDSPSQIVSNFVNATPPNLFETLRVFCQGLKMCM